MEGDLWYFEMVYSCSSKYLFAVKTKEEKQKWVTSLRKAVEELGRKGREGERKAGDVLECVMCQGWLKKRGDFLKVWNDRYFRLRGNTLFFSLTERGDVRSKIEDLDK